MGLCASWEQREGRQRAQEAQAEIGGRLMTGHRRAGLERGPPHRLSQVTGSQRPPPQGTAKMLLQKGQHPALLRTDVCTPGGTTIYGLHALEQGGLRAATMSAVEAATCRAKELSRK